MQGKLIVIDGLDGSGKATQTKLLFDELSTLKIDVKHITFPNYESPSSALVKMYLGGEFGQKPEDTGAYAASTFYTVDRYASYKTIWQDFYLNGGVVLADRYTTSNAIHQCSKLDEKEWDFYLDWLFDFEYNKIGIPKPNIVIYLDVDNETASSLLQKRYGGNEDKKDIHEKDAQYLAKSKKAANYCAKKLGWKTILCSENNQLRSIADIHKEIVDLV